MKKIILCVLHTVINHHNYVDVCDYVYDDKYEELIEDTLDELSLMLI